MQSIRLNSHIGPDGILKLEVPVGMADTDIEVMVIMQPLPKKPAAAATNGTKTPEELGWPPGFFEETYGCMHDTPLVREDQGEYEVREEFV